MLKTEYAHKRRSAPKQGRTARATPYTVEVPYNYYILHVDLENFNLSHVPVYIMGEEQLSMYAMLFTYPVAGAPDKVIALLVGMVLFVVNEANRVENQVIMQMSLST